MKNLITICILAGLIPACTFAEYSGGINQSQLATKVDTASGTATNLTASGNLTLTSTVSTAYSVGYWTNSVTGVGTNGVYVRKVYTPAGTTNTYYSLYQ